MSARRDCHRCLPRCVLLTLLVASCAAREICDKTKCPGPLKFYRELDCTPVYKNPNDCCPEAFNCSYLDNLSRDKCYVNGHEYNLGEQLRDEDKNPCDLGCTCSKGYSGRAASFICAAVDCGYYPQEENCFQRHSYDSCCPGPPVCLKEGETRATCEVDGVTYNDGDTFKPKSDPDLDCTCLPNYKGENIKPFCTKPKHGYCDPLFRHADDIHEKCAPVFYSNQNPQTDCSYSSRCHSENDTIVHNHDGKSVSETDKSKMCVFGNMTMHIGDVLNEGDTYSSICVKCTCEVPPFPTCVQQIDCDYSRVKQP
nr:BMP-binding endothelial regulator protein-like [Megalopta genalis]